MDWGAELRKFRNTVGMKQDVAASHLGVSQAYISRMESGNARPSQSLAERISKLIQTPKHRPHFEHWLATVLHSPHFLVLSSLQESDVRVEAVSPALEAAGSPWTGYRKGHMISEELGEAANAEIERLIRLGVFSGEVSAVDGLWYSQTGEIVRFWRTINVPVRDQIGNWYLHSTHVEAAREAYEARLQNEGESLLVYLFGRSKPVPARQLLKDQPPGPPAR